MTIDKCVATLWTTLMFVANYRKAIERYYLVQSWEPGFYTFGNSAIIEANATYCITANIKYITISKWCQNWLRENYHKDCIYARNGLDIGRFKYKPRDFNKDKIVILIEGSASDKYKNVDESFKIIENLDREKFIIRYLTYTGTHKAWYQYDELLAKIPYDMVHEVYEGADILIKTSLLESFSYPPIEMMATGGLVVAILNDGNSEYMVNGENCLTYTAGDIEEACMQIQRILDDDELRKHLVENGLTTARDRDWKLVKDEIVGLYQ